MPANKQEAEEECPIISLVVEPWKKNQLEQFTPVHRIRGYPWRLRLYSRNGYMQVEVLCEKSKEAELWQCGATITMSEPLDVFHTYHLSSWDETKIILIGELTNSIPIIKGDLVEVKITTNQHGSKWLSRPFLNPSETSNEVFVIGEERKNIKVHKEFLMSHSPFFGDLFTDYNEFPIEGVEYEEISNILAMACGFDGASLTDDNVHRVVELARRFELEIVVDRVVSYLLSAACSLPVYQKLDVAQQYNRPFLKDMLLARYEKTSALKELVDSADFEQLSPETLRLLFMKRCSIYRMWHNTGIAAPRCKTVAPKMNYPNLDANELKDGIIVFGEKKKKKKIKINKKTLATQSSFFDHLFNGLWKEKDMTEIPLADVEYEEFACVIALLYDSDIAPLRSKAPQFLSKILRLSDFFDLKVVEGRVVKFLLSPYASYLSVHEKLFIADQCNNSFLRESFIPLYKSEVQLKALSEMQEWESLSIDTFRVIFQKFCI